MCSAYTRCCAARILWDCSSALMKTLGVMKDEISLKDMAVVIRSKNAGPYELTLDILLRSEEMFQKMRAAWFGKLLGIARVNLVS